MFWLPAHTYIMNRHGSLETMMENAMLTAMRTGIYINNNSSCGDMMVDCLWNDNDYMDVPQVAVNSDRNNIAL